MAHIMPFLAIDRHLRIVDKLQLLNHAREQTFVRPTQTGHQDA